MSWALLGRDSPQTYCRKCDINQIYNDIWLRARNIWYANGLQLMLGQEKEKRKGGSQGNSANIILLCIYGKGVPVHFFFFWQSKKLRPSINSMCAQWSKIGEKRTFQFHSVEIVGFLSRSDFT